MELVKLVHCINDEIKGSDCTEIVTDYRCDEIGMARIKFEKGSSKDYDKIGKILNTDWFKKKGWLVDASTKSDDIPNKPVWTLDIITENFEPKSESSPSTVVQKSQKSQETHESQSYGLYLFAVFLVCFLAIIGTFLNFYKSSVVNAGGQASEPKTQ